MKLLEKDPEKRITSNEALNHPWFKMEFTDFVENVDPSQNITKYASTFLHSLVELKSGENSRLNTMIKKIVDNPSFITEDNKKKEFPFEKRKLSIPSLPKASEKPLLKKTLEKEFYSKIKGNENQVSHIFNEFKRSKSGVAFDKYSNMYEKNEQNNEEKLPEIDLPKLIRLLTEKEIDNKIIPGEYEHLFDFDKTDKNNNSKTQIMKGGSVINVCDHSIQIVQTKSNLNTFKGTLKKANTINLN